MGERGRERVGRGKQGRKGAYAVEFALLKLAGFAGRVGEGEGGVSGEWPGSEVGGADVGICMDERHYVSCMECVMYACAVSCI